MLRTTELIANAASLRGQRVEVSGYVKSKIQETRIYLYESRKAFGRDPLSTVALDSPDLHEAISNQYRDHFMLVPGHRDWLMGELTVSGVVGDVNSDGFLVMRNIVRASQVRRHGAVSFDIEIPH